jgi:hypothetical protein
LTFALDRLVPTGDPQVPTAHERLFARYVKELRDAKDVAEEWWQALLDAESAKTRDRDLALREIQRRWPLGPAAHPYVIGTIRKYFLACEALNDDGDEEVYPHVFVSEWLLDEDTEDLGDFMSVLNYWPIGLDSDGDFI